MTPVLRVVRTAAGWAVDGEPSSTVNPPPPPPPPPPAKRLASEHPHPSSSWWNRSLGAGATVAPKTDTRVQNIATVKAQLNSHVYTDAYWVTTTAHPVVTMRITTREGVEISRHTVRRPPGARLSEEVDDPTLNPDAWLTIVAPDGRTATDYYKAQIHADGTLSAIFMKTYDLITHSGNAEAGFMKAGDLAMRSGMLTALELSPTNPLPPRERIRHMLTISAPNEVFIRPSADSQGTGYRLPLARGIDGNGATAYNADPTKGLPMGTVLTIPQSVNPDSWNTDDTVKAIGWALRDYGGVLGDRSAFVTFYCWYGAVTVARAGVIKAGIQTLIKPEMTFLTNQTVEQPLGPGAPLREALPEPVAA